MLDKRAFRILNIIVSMTPDGESAVIEKSEIASKFGEEIDFTDLDVIVENLALNDMISISFTDDKCYFITPRPRGRIAFEKSRQAVREQQALNMVNNDQSAAVTATQEFDFPITEIQPPAISLRKLAIICASSSFFGGIIAAVVAFIIARFC